MADPTDYGPGWHAATAVAAPARGRLNIELDVDVCVIGAGLAGLTAALEVARRGWSVAVLEARRVAWSASGRNAGVVRPGFAADPKTLVEKVGLEQARQLWALSESGVEYVRRTIREIAMPGVEMEQSGWLHASRTGDDAAIAAGVALLSALGAAAELWPEARVRAALRSERYFSGIFLPNAFAINPLNYALGLAAAAEAAGVRIFEETPALEIDPAGVRKRITTPAARLRAGHVVLAGNVQIGGLIPALEATLLPVSSYLIATEPLGERLHEAIRFRGAVSDSALADQHYHVVGGDRLMWSGRCTLWRGEPRRHVRALLAAIRRTYPQLGKLKAEYAWSGTFGDTVHRMPQIGEFAPGVWLLSGFGGHGINTTAMGGEIVAGAIVDGNQDWRAFQPFDLVWAGGGLGRAAVQAAYWYGRSRERVQGRLARRRRAAQQPQLEADVVPSVEPSPEPEKPSRKKRRKTRRQNKPSDPAPAQTPGEAG